VAQLKCSSGTPDAAPHPLLVASHIVATAAFGLVVFISDCLPIEQAMQTQPGKLGA